MSTLNLELARRIIAGALAEGASAKMAPLSVVVLDVGGRLKAFEREDGAANLRFAVANGKAAGAIGLGVGSRALMARAEQQPYFVASVNGAFGGALVPVPGGVLVRDAAASSSGRSVCPVTPPTTTSALRWPASMAPAFAPRPAEDDHGAPALCPRSARR